MVKGLLVSSAAPSQLAALVDHLNRQPGLEVRAVSPRATIDEDDPDVIYFTKASDRDQAEDAAPLPADARVVVEVEDLEELGLDGADPEDETAQRDVARRLAGVDAFAAVDAELLQRLRRRGVGEDRLVQLSSPSSVGSVEERAEAIQRAAGGALAQARAGKWRLERENHVLRMRDLAARRKVWTSRPSVIEFSTNNVCNLRCAMCSADGRPPVRRLDGDEVVAICDEVLPSASVMMPFATSEPLLGDFELLVGQCRKHGVLLNVITNGILLTPDRYEILRPVLARLQVSLDSHIPAIYEEIRAGAKLAPVVENIRRIAPLNAETNIEFLTSMVLMRQNYDSIVEYVDFVADLGVDSILIQQLINRDGSLGDLELVHQVSAAELQERLDGAARAAERRGLNMYVEAGRPAVHLHSPKRFDFHRWATLHYELQNQHPGFCYMAASYCAVHPDGQVYPCCLFGPELVMGNIKEQSFAEIWNGEKYQALREEMFSDRLRDVCARCTVWPEGAPSPDA